MLPETERLIAETVSGGETVRLANGMLSLRVNADWLLHSETAASKVDELAQSFMTHVAFFDPDAVGCFVMRGGMKLQRAFPRVLFGIEKNGSLVARLPGVCRWDDASNNEFTATENNPSRVYLIEDVLTTGNSIMRAVNALRDMGIGVSHAFALVDRGIGAIQRLRQNEVDVVWATEVRAHK